MYYIIAKAEIVGQYDRRPMQEVLQQWSNDLQCEVWLLEGQHAGMMAYPSEPVVRCGNCGADDAGNLCDGCDMELCDQCAQEFGDLCGTCYEAKREE